MTDDGIDDTEFRSGLLTRRRFVAAAGTGVAAGLAGCGGQKATRSGTTQSDGESEATTQSASETVDHSGEPKDSTLTFAQWAVPKDSQYNPYNGKNYAEPRRMLYDRLLEYNLATQSFEGYAVSDWQFDENTLTLTLRDGLKWHDGDDVTAADLATQLKLDMYTGGTLANYVSDVSSAVSKADKKSVEIEFTEVNERIVLGLVQPTRLAAKRDVYKDYLKKFEQASSEDEESQALNDLTNFALRDPVGNGPFKFEDADTQRSLLTKFEDHPDADQINVPETEWLYGPKNQKRWNMLINGQTDGSATLFMPSNKVQQLPDSVRVGRIPRHWGLGLVFNWQNEHFQKRKVRQAFAYVINREQAAKNSGAGTNTKLPVTVPSGLTGEFSGAIKDEWLNGVYDTFETYETNAETAAKLLKDAGYEKKNGTWTDTETGKALKAPLKAPAGFSDWVAGARTIVSQLDSFGIDATLLTKDTSTYWGKDYANGDFQLALQGWANYDRVYPYFHFEWLYTSGDATDIWGVPEQLDVPPLSNPEGDRQTVVPGEKVDTLSTQSGDAARKTIQQLAWITNQTLPVLPIQEKLAQTFLTDDDWNVPSKDSDAIQTYWPTEWLPRQGSWTAKTQ